MESASTSAKGAGTGDGSDDDDDDDGKADGDDGAISRLLIYREFFLSAALKTSSSSSFLTRMKTVLDGRLGGQAASQLSRESNSDVAPCLCSWRGSSLVYFVSIAKRVERDFCAMKKQL